MKAMNAADRFWVQHLLAKQPPRDVAQTEPRSYAIVNTAQEEARRVRQAERLAAKRRGES